LWLALLAFAVAPGICEEVAFRGFLLSGFGHGGRWGLAVLVSAATFGLMHLIPQQVFNAALLGIVLGLLAVRTNSLLPGIVFHVLYNGLEVLRFRNFTTLPRGGGWDWLWHIEGGEMSYQPLLLLVCGVGAALALGWLLSGDKRRDEAAEPLGDGLPQLVR
jgi:sodium transport system permease protein